MKLNQALSWKFLLPIGIILWVIGYGGAIGLLGLLLTAMGIIDLIRQSWNKRKKRTESKEMKVDEVGNKNRGNKIKVLFILIFIIMLLIIIGEAWFVVKLWDVEKQILLGPFYFNNGVGSGIYDNYISATGTWLSDTELAYPVQASEIICLRDSMLCTEAIAQISDDGLLFVSNDLYEIDTWNEKEVIAVDNYLCTRISIRFDRLQKQVTQTRTTTSTNNGCEGISPDPIHSHLGDGTEVWKKLRKK